MSTPMLDRAEEILLEIEILLERSDLEGVHATLDPRDIPKALAEGCVIVTPPKLTYPTYHQTEATFEVWIIAGPSQDIRAAWGRVDAITHLLATNLEDVAEADPEGYTPPGQNQAPVPAYVLKITETHLH